MNFRVVWVTALMLNACASVGPDYKKPLMPLPEAYSNQQQGNYSTLQRDIHWWQSLNDTLLNNLIDQTIQHNHDLRIAVANLREARALQQESTFDQFPTVTVGSSYVDRQRSAFSVPGIPTNAQREVELWNIGFDASWEVDFFGRVRRSIEARSADMEVSEAQRRNTIVSLLAEVSRNYIELRGLQQQLKVAKRNAENQKQTLEITLARLAGGRGTELDTARAREQLNVTLSNIPPWESAIAQSIHRISVLTGQQPSSLATQLSAEAALPTLPNTIAIGQPREQLRNRPDIQAAERRLAAATARIGINIADLFPRVTFNGNIAVEANSISALGSTGSDVFSFGPSLRWAGFNIGPVYARIHAAEARADALLANYEKTVLTALEETENALVAFGKQQARLHYLHAAVRESRKAHELAHIRFEGGVTDFLTVLNAEQNLLNIENQLAQTKTNTATALISIYKALGGGWEGFEITQSAKKIE